MRLLPRFPNSLSIQGDLNSIAAAGGGTLTLSGAGSLLVSATLNIGDNVQLAGDASNPQGNEYGMTIVGAPDTGMTYRTQPVVSINGKQSASIYNLFFDGNQPGYILCGAAITGDSSTSGTVINVAIQGARDFGVTAIYASSFTIQYLSLTLKRATPGSTESEGGAGVWCRGCTGAILDSAYIYANDYYNAGPPQGDGRAGQAPLPTADPLTAPYNAPPMDLVSFTDGSSNTIRHCHLGYGNTAGVYLAKFSINGGESGDVVWDNTVDHFRENGLDIADCSNCSIVTNVVTNSELCDLLLADTTNAEVEWNSFNTSGRWPSTWTYAEISMEPE